MEALLEKSSHIYAFWPPIVREASVQCTLTGERQGRGNVKTLTWTAKFQFWFCLKITYPHSSPTRMEDWIQGLIHTSYILNPCFLFKKPENCLLLFLPILPYYWLNIIFNHLTLGKSLHLRSLDSPVLQWECWLKWSLQSFHS